MFKEFLRDIKLFEKENQWLGFKWMRFEFCFWQPVGMLLSLADIIYQIIKNQSREGYILIAAMGVALLAWMLLIFLCLLRKKYSFHCLITVLALQAVSIPIIIGFSMWSIGFALAEFLILYTYYWKRKEIFHKERFLSVYYSKREEIPYEEKGESGTNKESVIIGGVIVTSLVIVMVALFLCIMKQNYLHKPAKITECVASAVDDTWNEKQAKVTADRWTSAVVEKNTEEIQKIISEMLVEQEEKVKFLFFFEKSEFQAGIDPKQCGDVLACIDAETQGLAYYSLARIGHYYDACSGSHEQQVEAKQDEGEIYVTIGHGGSKTKLAFVDMNETIGEEGKENLRQKDFSKENIVSVLADVYTDEDILFVGELAKAADKEAYAQVFKRDPDKLSAAGQDALYQYAYVLLCNNVEYDGHLYITKQDLEQLEIFSNGILQTLSNKKKEDHCERYLRILGDKGGYRMNAVADQMYENYKDKEAVVDRLPEFSLNSQLNMLFNAIEFRINMEKSYKPNNAMQVRNFEISYESLLRDCIYYLDDIFIDGEKTVHSVSIDKHVGNDTYYYSYDELSPEEAAWTSLYGDVVTCYGKVILRGKHDANAILKEAWLKNEGLSFMAPPELKEVMEKEFYPEQEEDSIIFSTRWLWGLPLKRDEEVPALYLVWSGKPYEYEDGEKSKINDLNSFSAYDMATCIDALGCINEWLPSEGLPYYPISEETYKEYDVISDYYFNDEE